MRSFRTSALGSELLKVCAESVGRVVDCYLSALHVLVDLPLALLPSIGPEPLLICRHGNVAVQLYDAVIALDDPDLSPRLIEVVATAEIRRKR